MNSVAPSNAQASNQFTRRRQVRVSSDPQQQGPHAEMPPRNPCYLAGAGPGHQRVGRLGAR
jgi:hypothetical protein